MTTNYTKKFKEFIQENNPGKGDYIVGYRQVDDAEIKIPLTSIDNAITSNKYIQKNVDDYANGLIRFNKGWLTNSTVASTVYLQGLDGWKLDKSGNLEIRSATIREFLEVPELRKNKITVMGNQFWFTDSATVKEVYINDNNGYDVYFKLEKGEFSSFELDDILKGIFHYDNGFYTVYLTVYELIIDHDTAGEIGIKVRSLNNRQPREAMLLARVTNSKNKERQGSIFADGIKKYIRVLDGYDPSNQFNDGSKKTLKVQIGNLEGLEVDEQFGKLEGYGLYAENAYLSGRIIVKNNPNKPGQILGVYRGIWSAEEQYYIHDQVTFKGQLFSSLRTENKGIMPIGDVSDIWWQLMVQKGEPGQSATTATIMELTNDNHSIATDYDGKNPIYSGADSTAYVYYGDKDVTDIYKITASVISPTDHGNKVQIVQNNNTVSLVHIADDVDQAVVRFIGTSTGLSTVYKDWSITKTKAGEPGEPAQAYWLVTDTPVIKKLQNGSYQPDPFVVRAFTQIGVTGTVDPFDGYIRIQADKDIKIVSGSVYQFTPVVGVERYIIELFKDSALTTLLDKEIISVVRDGIDGTSPYYLNLTNDNTTVPAKYDGTVTSYNFAKTNLQLFHGTSLVNAEYSIIPSDQNLTYTLSTSGELQITSIPPDVAQASLFIQAKVDGNIVASSTFTVTKAKEGADGKPITIYQLQPSVHSISKSNENIFDPEQITVKVFKYTGNEPYVVVTDKYVRYKLSDDSLWTDVFAVIKPTLQTIWIRIELYDTRGGTLLDAETIPVLSDGKDGINPDWKIYIFKEQQYQPSTPLFKYPPSSYPTDGWYDIPNSNGIWWMSNATSNGDTQFIEKWSTPIRITGEDGQDGDYTDFKFAVNSSLTDPPFLDKNSRYPAGWSDDTPEIMRNQYMWMTFAKIKADNTLFDKWADPVRISGETGDQGIPGIQGPAGTQGPSIVFAGIWDPYKQYYGYNDTQTCVKHNGSYFYTKTVSKELSPLAIPTGLTNNPETTTGKIYWSNFAGEFESVATGLLLSERIASAELSVNKVFIVDRNEFGDIIAKDGSIINKDEELKQPTQTLHKLDKGWYMDQGVIRSIATYTSNGSVIPKLTLTQEGKLSAVDADVSGIVHINSGSIGAMQVYGDSSWAQTVNTFIGGLGAYYLRKNIGVTITPEGHIIGKDYFLSGNSDTNPSVFVGDVYLPIKDLPDQTNQSLLHYIRMIVSMFDLALIGDQYAIKAKLPLFSTGSITAFATNNMSSLQSIWDSMPVDHVTIELVEGKLSYIGKSGGISNIVLPAMKPNSALNGAIISADGKTLTFTAREFNVDGISTMAMNDNALNSAIQSNTASIETLQKKVAYLEEQLKLK